MDCIFIAMASATTAMTLISHIRMPIGTEELGDDLVGLPDRRKSSV